MRRNFSLVARCSLKFTRCSLIAVKSLVTRCKFPSLLTAKFARYSLQEITRHSVKNSLVTRCRICSLQKFARFKNSVVARCKIRSIVTA